MVRQKKKEFVYKDDSDGLEPVIDLTQHDEPVVNKNNNDEVDVFIYLSSFISIMHLHFR